MQYVVCYDISDDARRTRVASAMLDFGVRVQESVFVANLDDDLSERMIERLRKLIDEEHDRMHLFQLCAACAAKTQVLGTAEMVEDHDFYVI